VPCFREFAGIDTDRVHDQRSEPADKPVDGEDRGAPASDREDLLSR
jgi:hypothetical protein